MIFTIIHAALAAVWAVLTVYMFVAANRQSKGQPVGYALAALMAFTSGSHLAVLINSG